jgi:HK97 gp10 family phage protein
MIDAQLQADLNAVITRLKKIEPFVRKSGKADMMEAAKILESAVKGRTPIGSKPHKRKGITYRPGNLRKSMRRLNFRRSNAAFVGAKLGDKLPDGYYAHMVERGTTTQSAQYFMRSAVSAAGPQTLRFAAQLITRRIQSFGSTNGF